MREASERGEPFQLKGGSYSLVVLKLLDPGDEGFFPQLKSKIRQAPSLFRHAPVVLDFCEVKTSPLPFDLAEFGQRLRQHDLVPVAVQGADAELQKAAIAAGFSVVPAGRKARLDLPEQPESALEQPQPEGLRGDPSTFAEVAEIPSTPVMSHAVASAESRMRPTVLVTEPVRSGRRIHAPKGDLIVLAPVSQGAELLADGHIHIYSSLRGRALAGLNGDRSARIFCHSLEAELISIAGLYRVSEDIEEAVYRKSVMIFLEADRLRVDTLS